MIVVDIVLSSKEAVYTTRPELRLYKNVCHFKYFCYAAILAIVITSIVYKKIYQIFNYGKKIKDFICFRDKRILKPYVVNSKSELFSVSISAYANPS